MEKKKNRIISISCPIGDKNGTHLVKMRADAEAWVTLGAYYQESPKRLGETIYSSFVLPALMESNPKNDSRGPYKKAEPLINRIRTESTHLYAFTVYWKAKPFQAWPQCLQAAVGLIREESGVAKEMFNASDVTRLYMEKIYANRAKKAGIKVFDDPDNFRKTYITAGKPNIVKRIMLDGKTQDEIKNLPNSDHILRSLFKYLRLI